MGYDPTVEEIKQHIFGDDDPVQCSNPFRIIAGAAPAIEGAKQRSCIKRLVIDLMNNNNINHTALVRDEGSVFASPALQDALKQARTAGELPAEYNQLIHSVTNFQQDAEYRPLSPIDRGPSP